MRLLPVAILVGLPACAQIFGIDNTSAPPAGPGATLALERQSVGATVVHGPLDVSSEMASWLVPDAVDPTVLSPVTGTVSAPGTWTADVDGSPAVLFTLPDVPAPAQHLWALQSNAMLGNFVGYEHTNPQPAPMAAQLALNVTLPAAYDPAAGESFVLEVIGAWMQHGLSGAEVPALGAGAVTATIPYAAFSSMVGGPATRISGNDAVLLLRYAGSNLTGVFDAPAFDQGDATDMVNGALANVVHDQTLSASIDPSPLPTRYSAVRPAVSGLGIAWSLTAAPGAGLGLTAGPQLQAGGVAMTDTTINATYGNPFQSRGWSALVRYATAENRSFATMGGTLGLSAGLFTIAAAGTGLDFTKIPAGLPQTISLGDIRLTSDGMQVTLDPLASVEISFLADLQTNTLNRAEVSEITTSGGALVRQLVVEATSLDSTFRLPPGLLESGHTYVIRIVCIQGGYPNAATGDLQTQTLPFSVGYADSGVFTVE